MKTYQETKNEFSDFEKDVIRTASVLMVADEYVGEKRQEDTRNAFVAGLASAGAVASAAVIMATTGAVALPLGVIAAGFGGAGLSAKLGLKANKEENKLAQGDSLGNAMINYLGENKLQDCKNLSDVHTLITSDNIKYLVKNGYTQPEAIAETYEVYGTGIIDSLNNAYEQLNQFENNTNFDMTSIINGQVRDFTESIAIKREHIEEQQSVETQLEEQSFVTTLNPPSNPMRPEQTFNGGQEA